VSKRRPAPYEFTDDLALGGVEPGTNLPVAGPTMLLMYADFQTVSRELRPPNLRRGAYTATGLTFEQ